MALFIVKGIFCLMLIGVVALCFYAWRRNIRVVFIKPKRRVDMCDFSLDVRNTRLAAEGEQLFINMFDAGSKGMASRSDFLAARPNILKRIADFLLRPGENILGQLPAVCVPPGAQLRLSGIPKWLQDKYRVGATEDVTFTQVTHDPWRYRDAFRFSNGRTLSLQNFPVGVQIKVLQLALEEEPTTTPVETWTSLRFDAIPQRR